MLSSNLISLHLIRYVCGVCPFMYQILPKVVSRQNRWPVFPMQNCYSNTRKQNSPFAYFGNNHIALLHYQLNWRITGDKAIHQFVVMTSAKIGMNQIESQNPCSEYANKRSNKNHIFPCQSTIRGNIGHFNLNSTAPAINMCYFGGYKLDFWTDFVNVKR